MNLEETLKKASYKIWEEMEPALNNDDFKVFQIAEPGLTSMALKSIVNSDCKQIVAAKMISGQQEDKEGYDFELCIGSKKKNKWIRYFIQAKRQTGYDLNGTYSSIYKLQLDVLRNFSKKEKSIPLYALYKNLQLTEAILYDYYNSTTFFDKKAMGITLALPDLIEEKNKFCELHDSIRRPYFYNRHIYHPLNFMFYQDNMHAAVPWHELAYYTIELAEEINQVYKKKKSAGILGFFFFFFDPTFLGDNDDLIPIITGTPESLISSFNLRQEIKNDSFNSKAILILDANEQA